MLRSGRALRATLALALLALLVTPAVSLATPEGDDAPVRDGGFHEVLEGTPVLHLRGTPEERGHAHGRLMAREIHSMVEGGLALVVRQGRDNPMTLVDRFTIPDAIRAELEGMVRGVREGCEERGIDSTVQLPGEEAAPFSLDHLIALNTIADWLPFGCSSFSVWGDRTASGETLTARNLDYPSILTHAEVASPLVIVQAPRDGRLGWVGVSWAGLVGAYSAMNEEGVTLTIHDVHARPEGDGPFVPRSFGLRHVMEGTPAGEDFAATAASILRERPVMYGNNIHVSAPAASAGTPAAVIEWGPDRTDGDGVTVRRPTEGANHVVCTNHWRDRRDPSPCNRFRTLADALDADDEVGPERALELLGDVAMQGMLVSAHSVVLAPDDLGFGVSFAPGPGRPAPAVEPTLLDAGELLEAAASRGLDAEPAPEGQPIGAR